MPQAANPYKIFLDLEINPEKPDFIQIFGLNPKSCSVESITVAADKVIAKVRAQKPGDKAKEWAQLIDVLTKAKKQLIAKVAKAQKNNAAGKPAEPSQSVSTYAPPTPSKASPKASPATPPSLQPSKTDQEKKSTTEKRTKAKSGNKEGGNQNPKAATNPASPPSALPPKTSKKDKPHSPGKKDDMSFTLDAPDQQDSFDSDTHLSTNHFNSPAAVGATAPTVDPMAAVDDPTQDWESYDISSIDEHGFIAGGGGVATATRLATQKEAPTGLSEKTYYTQSYKQKSKVGLIIGGTLLAMVIVGGISYGVIFGFGGKDTPQTADATNANKDDETKKKNENTNSEKEEPKKEEKQEDVNRPKKISDPIEDDIPDPDKDKSGDMKDEGDPKKMSMDEDDKKDTPNPDTPTPESPTPDEPKKSTDDPAMKKEEPMDLPQPKNSDIAQLAQLLTDAKQKLNDRNLVDATRLIEKAKSLPILPDHKLKLDRLAQINDLYNQFWNKVVEGCGKLKGLDEIKFSETNIIKVVESSEEKIIYRALGKRFEKAPRELPLGVAMKIAEKELDMESAEGRMIKGTVFAIDSINNEDRILEAKNLWEEAKLVGGETDELILYLDDTYDDLLAAVIKKEKVPDEKTSEEAQTRFKEKYADDLKTAGRNQTTSTDFAKQLLKDVPTMDDPSDRHANFVAAVFYAGKFGDVELTMKAISDMSKWFSIDFEEQTLDALTKMNRGRLKPDQKREIMRTAFEFMDRSKAAAKPENELKFAELALAAAKGARDPKLVATATRELARVKASQDDANNN